MRVLIISVAALILVGCSDSRDTLTPAERAKRAPRLDEGTWKVYGGTESGITDDKTDGKKDEPREKK
jgi:hypothetical protein